MQYTDISALAKKLRENVGKVIVGKDTQIELILTCMLSGGHIVPIEGCFDGHFSVTETEVPEADTGKPVTSYRWAIK